MSRPTISPVENGRVTDYRAYVDRAEGLRAAGLAT